MENWLKIQADFYAGSQRLAQKSDEDRCARAVWRALNTKVPLEKMGVVEKIIFGRVKFTEPYWDRVCAVLETALLTQEDNFNFSWVTLPAAKKQKDMLQRLKIYAEFGPERATEVRVFCVPTGAHTYAFFALPRTSIGKLQPPYTALPLAAQAERQWIQQELTKFVGQWLLNPWLQ